MQNVLFYTLSTIAQTLAGALALVLALVVFGYQRLYDVLRSGTAEQKRQATRVRSYLTRAITLSLVDIGFCFVALPFTSLIAPNAFDAGLVLVIAVAAGTVCLFFYWQLMTSVIRLLVWPGTS